MNFLQLQSLFPLLLITAFLSINVELSLCQDASEYVNCSNPINCGSVSGISYPFWGVNRARYCGRPGFEVQCLDGVTVFNMSQIMYRILEMNSTSTSPRAVTVARQDYQNTICPTTFVNTTLDLSLFGYASGCTNMSFYYQCNINLGIPSPGSCTISNTASPVYLFPGTSSDAPTSPFSCEHVVIVPVYTAAATTLGSGLSQQTVVAVVDGGFPMELVIDNDQCNNCEASGGKCGLNTTDGGLNGFSCYCQDKAYATTCNTSTLAPAPQPQGKKKTTTIAIGVAVSGAILFGIGVGFYVFYFIQRKKKKKLAAQSQSKELPTPLTSKSITTPSTNLSQSQSIPSYPSFTSKSDYDKGSTYFGVQVFSYSELEDATENFNPEKELGDGGFGTVYYGKLHDGRVVAVKRLYENNFRRVEQFMNEVEILTRLEHRNLVKLYGCTSKRSRELLLVYEYIPNGTVADHLHGKRVESGFLSWPVRLSIAIETAEALAFLHRSDVIHRDVKTNNILIDNDFCVKVADFGLSRLFPNDATHVSTAPQGTPGYVDPEYYQCYQLTSKSDVYSFGVVLIELLSSLQAVDTNRHRHDINLANLAINKIQNHLVNELVDPRLGFETDYPVRRMATAVAELAFRCLQQERDMRPTMDEVLEGLKAIQNEDIGSENGEAVILDIGADEVGLLRNMPPPLSPDSSGPEKLVFKRWDKTI